MKNHVCQETKLRANILSISSYYMHINPLITAKNPHQFGAVFSNIVYKQSPALKFKLDEPSDMHLQSKYIFVYTSGLPLILSICVCTR